MRDLPSAQSSLQQHHPVQRPDGRCGEAQNSIQTIVTVLEPTVAMSDEVFTVEVEKQD